MIISKNDLRGDWGAFLRYLADKRLLDEACDKLFSGISIDIGPGDAGTPPQAGTPQADHGDACTCYQCQAYSRAISACDEFLQKVAKNDTAVDSPPKKIKWREFL